MKKMSVVSCQLLIVGMLLAILSGCAINDQIIKNYQNTSESETKEFQQISNLLLEPVDTVGILETHSLRNRKTNFYEVDFPEILFLGEVFPGRIKWYGWIIDENDNEYLSQLLWMYRVRLNGKTVGVISVEGNIEEMKNPKAIGLSTRFQFAYSYSDEKEIPIDRKKFASEYANRRAIGQKIGTDIKGLKNVNEYMYNLIDNWNRVEGPRGTILTPLSEEQFMKIAEKNPAYSYSQKFIEYSTASIYTDFYATGLNLFFELVEAAGEPSKGWDFAYSGNSRIMALKAKHLLDVKLNGVNEMIKKITENQIQKRSKK